MRCAAETTRSLMLAEPFLQGGHPLIPVPAFPFHAEGATPRYV